MKKLFALALALVLALSIAAPAMAFTSTAPDDEADSPYELDIYLVEYEDKDFFGIVSLPAADRGYAKNEIVAAVVEVFVPEDTNPADHLYFEFEFSGENVSLDVTENNIVGGMATLKTVNALFTTFQYDNDGTLWQPPLFPLNADEDVTYKYLFYAKVTGDDASLTAALHASIGTWIGQGDPNVTTLPTEDYIFVKDKTVSDAITYTVISIEDGPLFIITVDEGYASTGLQIFFAGVPHTVIALADGTLGFIRTGAGTLVDADSGDYEDLMEVYEEKFVETFGLDYDLLGGVVDDDFFLDFAGADDVEDTVAMAPWTAYVTVPDNIVVDPPKTGDAAGILGFIMLVLAGAAATVIRKART